MCGSVLEHFGGAWKAGSQAFDGLHVIPGVAFSMRPGTTTLD
jgi:hypothetical protein